MVEVRENKNHIDVMLGSSFRDKTSQSEAYWDAYLAHTLLQNGLEARASLQWSPLHNKVSVVVRRMMILTVLMLVQM